LTFRSCYGKRKKKQKGGREMKEERQVFILYCPFCNEIVWFSEEDFLKYELHCCDFGRGKEVLLGVFTE